MIMSDLLSLCLRIGELAFSATVAGINGQYLHSQKGTPPSSIKRFIYTEVVAALSILYAIIFLFPFMSSFLHWPADFILFALWMVAFGLLANFISPVCGSVWNWHGITGKSQCSKFKADLAFCFLASIFFLASAIIGLWVTYRSRRRGDTVVHTSRRRRWGSSRV